MLSLARSFGILKTKLIFDPGLAEGLVLDPTGAHLVFQAFSIRVPGQILHPMYSMLSLSLSLTSYVSIQFDFVLLQQRII